MIPSDVRAIFFDAVGTLLFPDPPAPLVYAEVGRRFGSRLAPSEIGVRFRNAFQREEAGDLRTSEAFEIERWRCIVGAVLDDVTDAEGCFAELFAHFARPEAWRLHEEAAEVLAELAARGHELGLASNYDARLRIVVAGLPALRPVRHLVISSEVGWRKPAVEFFTAACRQVNLPPAQVLHVGDDMTNDYLGARQAGLGAVLLEPGEKELGPGTMRIRRLGELV